MFSSEEPVMTVDDQAKLEAKKRKRDYDKKRREKRKADKELHEQDVKCRKAYVEANSEKLKAYSDRYYQEHKEEKIAAVKSYNQTHKEEKKKYYNEYFQANKNEIYEKRDKRNEERKQFNSASNDQVYNPNINLVQSIQSPLMHAEENQLVDAVDQVSQNIESSNNHVTVLPPEMITLLNRIPAYQAFITSGRGLFARSDTQMLAEPRHDVIDTHTPM